MSRAKYTSARERAEKKGSEFTQSSCLELPKGVDLFKPKEGTMLLDILPFKAGEGNPYADEGQWHWERQYYVHRNIGANRDWFICPRMTSKEKCPICEYRRKLMDEGSEENEDLIKDLAPKQRQLFNVINLREPDKGVQIWDVSYHLFGKLLDERIRTADEEDEWEKFFFLEGGLTLKVAFGEESIGSWSFLDAVSIDFKVRKEDYDEDMLEKTVCLDEVLIQEPYDKIKKVFLESQKEEDEDEEEEEEKPKHKHKSESKRSSRDEEDEPEDEDEDEKPKKKKTPKDDDDWSDFDEDEEEKPKKKKSKSEDEDEEESEEEERPKKKRKPDEDEDDESDEPDESDEDEEDEKPKKRKFGRDKEDDDDGWDKPEDTEKEMKRRKKKSEDDDE